MKDTVSRYMKSVQDVNQQLAVTALFYAIADLHSCRSLRAAGLVIKAGGSAIVKTGGTDWYGIVQGKVVKKTAATDMAALSGTVTNAKFNYFAFYVDVAGNLTTLMGTEGATLAAAKLPDPQVQKTMIGFIIVNPTGTGNFVGGTTALDDATVVPNVVYIDVNGSFDHTFLR